MSAKTQHVLNVKERTAKGSAEARRVRNAGMIPAIVYGKGVTPSNVTVQAAEWEALQKFEFNIVNLVNGDKTVPALVKEVQKNFISGKANHIDFFAIDMNAVITAVIPLHQGHTAPVGLSQGGLLEQYIHEIEVECLPANLPEGVVVDVSGLNMGDTLCVKDIPLPEGVKAKTHGDINVFKVINPLTIAEDVPAAAAAPADGATPAEPEVVGEKEKAERAAAREEEKKNK